MTGDKYKEDGVNIEEGDSFSEHAAQICKATYRFSPFVKVADMAKGNFRGPRGVEYHLPKGCTLGIAADGPGTKVVLIDAAGSYRLAAHEVAAMTGTDITRWGGIPLIFASVLDFFTIGEEGDEVNKAAREVIDGAYDVAKAMRFVILTGETAELGPCVGSENPDARLKFNWAGFMTGAYHHKKMILGDTLREGQIIMVLQELGFRANGISSVRKALKIKYGENWWANPAAIADIKACATPSVLYDLFLAELNGWYDSNLAVQIESHLIVHLSGGAFKSKLGDDMLFPLGLSAEIDNLFEPPEIMKKCAKWRGMSEPECYKTWNGGQGVLVVIDQRDEQEFIDKAAAQGLTAQRGGEIVKKDNPSVIIESRFGSGQTICFEPGQDEKKE